jgi:hypothetical protein
MSEDQRELNWSRIHMDAIKHRLNQADAGDADSITIRRDVFDGLVRIVESAMRANSFCTANTEFHLSESEGVHYCTAENKALGATISVEAGSDLAALMEAKRQFEYRINEMLR